jgi:hypothetical protein
LVAPDAFAAVVLLVLRETVFFEEEERLGEVFAVELFWAAIGRVVSAD